MQINKVYEIQFDSSHENTVQFIDNLILIHDLPKVLSIYFDKYIIMNTYDNSNFNDLKEINLLLKEYKPYYNMYKKLLVVKNVKEGMSRGEAAKVVNVHRKTAENWVKLYNENGLDGLEPNYSNCGLNCKLSNEQLSELKNLVVKEPGKYTVEDIRILIMKKYNIRYSKKQTWFILRRRLGLSYDGNKLVS